MTALLLIDGSGFKLSAGIITWRFGVCLFIYVEKFRYYTKFLFSLADHEITCYDLCWFCSKIPINLESYFQFFSCTSYWYLDPIVILWRCKLLDPFLKSFREVFLLLLRQVKSSMSQVNLLSCFFPCIINCMVNYSKVNLLSLVLSSI